VEAMADIITVQQVGMLAEHMETLFQPVCDGGFAGTGQTREPKHSRFLEFLCCACLLVEVEGLQMHIRRLTKSTINHSCTHSRVCKPVDQDERAGYTIIRVRLERNLIHRLEMAKSNLVEVETRSSLAGETID